MAASGKPATGLLARLRTFALRFPGTTEEFPWGERVVKVKGKVFVFMGKGEQGVGISVKLPESGPAALMLPFASPTGYGLEKSGWVSAAFEDEKKAPVGLLEKWVEESYRAVAPKRLVAEWESGWSAKAPARGAAARKAAGARALKKRAVKPRAPGRRSSRDRST